VVRLVLVDGHLLQRATLEQLDERVARDLAGEPRAARAQHTALAVQADLRGDGHGLLVPPLAVDEPALARPVGQRLVLQRALAALVAHRAVERVVDQQELELGLLRRARRLAGQVRVDDHALGDLCGARRHLPRLVGCPREGDVDEALAARARRREQRVVTEPRDRDLQLLGGPDDQRALRHGDLLAVDRECDLVVCHVGISPQIAKW
jgi:hypothetical protein